MLQISSNWSPFFYIEVSIDRHKICDWQTSVTSGSSPVEEHSGKLVEVTATRACSRAKPGLRAHCLETRCLGAHCLETHCLRAHCLETHCLGAHCLGAHCLGAHCLETRCLGAHCLETHCLGAHCLETRCLGAHCLGVMLVHLFILCGSFISHLGV